MFLRKIIITLAVCLSVAIFVCGCSFGEGSGATANTSISDSASTPLADSSSGQFSSGCEEEWDDSSGLPSEGDGDNNSDVNEDSVNSGTDDGTSSGSSSSSSSQTESSSSVPNQSNVFEVWVEDDMICWTDVGANVYALYVGEKQFAVTKTSYVPKDLSMGVYKVVVKAFLSDDGSVSTECQTEYVVKAQKPNVLVDGNVISWSAVSGAKGYNIYKEGVFITQIQANSFIVEQDGIYTVSVVFEDERLNSDMSNQVEFGSNILSSPVLSRNGNYIEWTEVANAQTYLIYVNGKVTQMIIAGSGNRLDFMQIYSLKYATDYPNGVTITVVATATGFDNSAHSNEIFFTV